jgi:hypothetical protein
MSDSKSYHDQQWAIYKARILKLLKNNRADLRNTTGALPGEQLPVGGPAGAGYPPEAHAIGGALHTGSLTAALHGNLPGGALHANVIAAGAAGFMSGADKTKLDGIASGATANTGTVTSVALTAPAFLSVAGSPVTTIGTLALSLATQSANLAFAGPATGAAAAPTFRSLVANDIPSVLNAHGVRVAIGSLASGLRVDWISGDTHPTLYVGSTNTSNDQDSIQAQSFSGNALVVQSTNGLAFQSVRAGAVTNTVVTGGNMAHRSTGVIAAGFGLALRFQLQSSTTSDQDAARIAALWSDATHATRTAALTFWTVNSAAALAEKMRITGAGALWLGRTIGGLTGAGDLDVTGNTANGGYNDFTSLTAPANPSTGTTRLYASSRAGTTIDAMAYRTSLGTEVVIGRDLLVQVRNVSGATIAASQVVYCSGSSSSIARVELAQADATMSKLPPLGITTAAIPNNTNGLIMTRGVMILDTSGFAAGDTLYLSPTTPGAVTNVVPSHPNVEHVIGVVEFVNTSGLAMISIVPINLHRIDGTNQASFAIGDGTGTTKSLLFKKAGSVIGTLSWNPTASRTITLPDVTGTLAVASATAGQVYFAGASGVLSGDTALLWDNTNKRLGVGITPTTALHVYGTTGSTPQAIVEASSATSARLELRDGNASQNKWALLGGVNSTTDGYFSIYDARQGQLRLTIDISGNVGIGTSAPTTKLHVRGAVSHGGYFDADAIGAAEVQILATGSCVYQFAIGTSLVRSSTGGLGAGSLGGVVPVPGAGSTTTTFYNDGSSILGVRVYSTGRVTILCASGGATFKAAFFYVGM